MPVARPWLPGSESGLLDWWGDDLVGVEIGYFEQSSPSASCVYDSRAVPSAGVRTHSLHYIDLCNVQGKQNKKHEIKKLKSLETSALRMGAPTCR
jgi:hypothetical protein